MLDLLGAGGFGAVYRARHVHTGQLVALKVLRTVARTNASAWEGLLREAKTMASIGHPNIARVFDAGVGADGTPFLAMEFVEGVDLYKCVQREGRPMAPARAVELVWQVLDALASAHARGVVHRDVKPANVMVSTTKGSDGAARERAMLLDFGISKLRDSEWAKTQPGLAMGTPGFMAPEQFENAAGADARSDVYAVGATLYFLLSGRLPHDGNTSEALVASMLSAPAQPLARVAPHVPASLCTVVDHALASEPSARWQDAQSFGAALQRAMKDAPHPSAALGSMSTMAADSASFGAAPTTANARANIESARTMAAASVPPPAHPTGSPGPAQHGVYIAPPATPFVAVAPSPASMGNAPTQALQPATKPAARRRWPWVVGAVTLLGIVGGSAYWLGTTSAPADETPTPPVQPQMPVMNYAPQTAQPAAPTMPAVPAIPTMPAVPAIPAFPGVAGMPTAPNVPGLDPEQQAALQMAAQMMAAQQQNANNPGVPANVPGLTPQQATALRMAAQMMAAQNHTQQADDDEPRVFGAHMPEGSLVYDDNDITMHIGMTASPPPMDGLQQLARAASPLIRACPRTAQSGWSATFVMMYSPVGRPSLHFFGGQPHDAEATCALRAIERAVPPALEHIAGSNILIVERDSP